MVLAAVLVVVAAGCNWAVPTFSADGTRHNTLESTIAPGNVGSLTAAWTATLGTPSATTATPVVADGTLVTVSEGRLLAFAADGTTGCSGAPLICQPLWTSGPAWPASRVLQPIIVGEHVLVTTTTGELRLYDLAGEEGCSGTPTTCAPVGTATAVPTPSSNRTRLTVADGIVFAYEDSRIVAFEVDDLITCTTTATACTPLWSAFATGVFEHVVVSGGVLYAADDLIGFETFDTSVVAFDADGSTGCSGVPRTCTPAWSTSSIGWSSGALAVVDGTVVITRNYFQGYDPGYEPDWPGKVFAFDVAACAAAAEPCGPTFVSTPLYTSRQGIAVADGTIYLRELNWQVPSPRAELLAFDLAGVDGCGGIPRTCQPVRTMIDPANGLQGWNPVVANGVVFLGPDAFDATGASGCSGTPVVCTPLRSGNAPTEAIVLDGRVHLQGTPPGGTSALIRTLKLP